MLNWRIFEDRRPKSPKETTSAGEYEQQYIQERAYVLWEADGSPEGKSEYYWFKAVEDVTAKRSFSGTLSRRTKRYFESLANWFKNLRIKSSRRRRKFSSGT